jgi:hypothetical protein
MVHEPSRRRRKSSTTEQDRHIDETDTTLALTPVPISMELRLASSKSLQALQNMRLQLKQHGISTPSSVYERKPTRNRNGLTPAVMTKRATNQSLDHTASTTFESDAATVDLCQVNSNLRDYDEEAEKDDEEETCIELLSLNGYCSDDIGCKNEEYHEDQTRLPAAHEDLLLSPTQTTQNAITQSPHSVETTSASTNTKLTHTHTRPNNASCLTQSADLSGLTFARFKQLTGHY